MPLKSVKSQEEFNAAVGRHGSTGSSAITAAVHFWAEWCEPCKHMDTVFEHLASENPHANFVRVEAEEFAELSQEFGVVAVPFFLFFKGGSMVDKLEGANPPELAHKVARHLSHPLTSAGAALGSSSKVFHQGGSVAANDVIESVLAASRAAQPGLAANHTFGSTPLLTQLSGSSGTGGGAAKSDAFELTSALKDRLQHLVSSHPIMLFMKGSPDAPQCGFSSRVVTALEKDVGKGGFGSFDILADADVRQGLKLFSDWPTFPQLYAKGELIGGCDIVMQMHEGGELKDVLKDAGVHGGKQQDGSAAEAEQKSGGMSDDELRALASSSTNMLFMKGTPDEPRCKFSRRVVEVLRAEGVEFGSFDILSSDDVREGLKRLMQWPTYPQLYHNGELVGGCDIIMEMKEGGELRGALTA